MRAPDMEKKIHAFALEGVKPTQVVALYKDKRLFFKGMESILGDPDEWMPTIEEQINKRIADNWVVLVEDRTGSFSDRAVLCDFDRLDGDGRTFLQRCFDWYFALQSRGALVFPESMLPYRLQTSEGGMIDFDNDEKGRLIYKVDWRRFTGVHKAILMCVAGAIMEDPASDRWLNEFLGKPNPDICSPLSRLLKHIHAVTIGQTISLSQQFEQRREEVEARKERGQNV